MLDGQHFPPQRPQDEPDGQELPYFPPVALVLQGLDVTELDFARSRVSVSSSFLKFIIGELARAMPFNPSHYAAANPDVEAARLAGEVATLHQHFVEQGYFERRCPHDLPFDSYYYVTQYEDLRNVFAQHDLSMTQTHFLNHGWQEGRVAVSWQRDEADRWVAAARKSMSTL